MGTYNVKFLPNDISVDVVEGTTIAEAAQQADAFISNLCGGEGVCGKCRIQISKGRAEAEEHAKGLFSQDEIMKGYVLACQTEVHDNLEVIESFYVDDTYQRNELGLNSKKNVMFFSVAIIEKKPMNYCEI